MTTAAVAWQRRRDRGQLLEPPRKTRVWQLDALRGLAVFLMVIDHLGLLLGLESVHLTLGRVAMPLFFVLGGHLAVKASRRLLRVAGVGLLLQLVVPWAGPGPLLLVFAGGAACVAALRAYPLVLWLSVLVGLTLGANGFAHPECGTYDVGCLLALMSAGALVSREQLVAVGSRLPSWLRHVGRYPLSVYAGHLLLLTVVFA